MTFPTRNARRGLDQDSQSGFRQQRSPSDWCSVPGARRAAFGTVAAPSCPNAIFPNNKRPECIFPEMEETFGPLRSASAPCLKIEVRFDFQYLQSDIRRLLRSAEAFQDQAALDESQRSRLFQTYSQSWTRVMTCNRHTSRFWTFELRFPSAPA